MEENIKKIADHYGYEEQSRQLIEEMAELTQAINKLWRAEKNEAGTEKIIECWEKVVEEIADVDIMLDQIKYLMPCEKSVAVEKEKKVKRQIERMRRGR